ncbi:helix-turn-helix domain-containing protein [Corynebacterium gerontici]|nr:helix-turn-helix domain-containing protein [Corynebacterium gerontici]
MAPLLEAASLMNMARSTAYRLAREGKLPFPVKRVGGRYYVPRAQMLQSLELTSGAVDAE